MQEDLLIVKRQVPATRGDFGALVMGGHLSLPEQLVDALRAADVRSATQLLALARGLPSALEHMLGWSVLELRLAISRLEATLKGELIASALRGAGGTPRGMGARAPHLSARGAAPSAKSVKPTEDA